ncbi:MAG: ECF transporter S component [Eubacteriales bacterium]|nr:ECF transporter S component [Eubacteriales bacterium]
MKKETIQKLTFSGLLAAAIILLTTLVAIPMPGGLGFLNLGDAGVLSAAFILGSPWGVLCAGAASALSDLLLGYAVYAPASFLVKGAMAGLFVLLRRLLHDKALLLAFLVSSLCVPAGYFLYEAMLYGAAAAAPNVLFNALQGAIGAAVAYAAHGFLTKLLQRMR